jgi:uncharacterized protein HemX
MNKTLLLIGGLGLGAGLMYALDPERGQQRRAQARTQLQTYRHRTNDLLDQTTHAIGRQTHGMQQAAHTIGQQTRELLARARPALISQRGVGEMRWPTMGQTGMERGLLILGCLGLGAGLMYLLDPNNGTRRRALVRDKAQAYWKRQEDFLGKTARDVRDRTRGLVAEARSHLSSTKAPDDASEVVNQLDVPTEKEQSAGWQGQNTAR